MASDVSSEDRSATIFSGNFMKLRLCRLVNSRPSKIPLSLAAARGSNCSSIAWITVPVNTKPALVFYITDGDGPAIQPSLGRAGAGVETSSTIAPASAKLR